MPTPRRIIPAALVALEARIHLRSAQGERVVEASEFFVDAFTTAMEAGEIVVAVEVAAEEPSEGYKYEKVRIRRRDFRWWVWRVRVKRGRQRGLRWRASG
jgi:carbon-monoxide dehydrogenase medium subunit